MAKKVEEAVITEPSFSKEQILGSKKYRERADLVGALLISGRTYTFEQVDAEIEKFMKKEIKAC